VGNATNNGAEISFINTSGGETQNWNIDTKTRVVFNTMPVFSSNGEKKGVVDMVPNSPFNGIYSPGNFELNTSDGKRVLTITWYRTSDANTWG
jgi:hypothetical protein